MCGLLSRRILFPLSIEMNKACVIAHQALYYFVRMYPDDHPEPAKIELKKQFVKTMDLLEGLYAELEAHRHKANEQSTKPESPCPCGHCEPEQTEITKTLTLAELNGTTTVSASTESTKRVSFASDSKEDDVPLTNEIMLG
jgi:hypothetical protein